MEEVIYSDINASIPKDVKDKLRRIDDTISLIDRSLTADDFYEGDRREIEKSRTFYEEQKENLFRRMARGVWT